MLRKHLHWAWVPTTSFILFGLYAGFFIRITHIPCFIVDPDSVILNNGILLAQKGLINDMIAPGVPGFSIIAFFALTLKPIAWLTGVDFNHWAFMNYASVLFALRILFFVIFTISCLLFLDSLLLMTGRKTGLFWGYIMLGSLLYFPNGLSGIQVDSETISFLLFSIWLRFTVRFWKKDNYRALRWAFFTAGVLSAQKLTNIPVLIASFLLLWGHLWPKNGLNTIAIEGSKHFGLGVLGFIAGILPALRQVLLQLSGLVSFIFYSGQYSSGHRLFFSLGLALAQIRVLFKMDHSLFLGFIILPIAWIINGCPISSETRKMLPLLVTGTSCFLLYAKFPTPRYQVPNLLLFCFATCVLMTAWMNNRCVLTAAFGLFSVLWLISPTLQFVSNINQAVEKSANLDRFLRDNPATRGRLYEYAKNEEFARLWSQQHGGRVFENELARITPPLYWTSPPYFRNITFIPGPGKPEKTVPIFSACWDQLIIQNSSLKRFLAQYPERMLRILSIPGTQMSIVKSNHCV